MATTQYADKSDALKKKEESALRLKKLMKEGGVYLTTKLRFEKDEINYEKESLINQMCINYDKMFSQMVNTAAMMDKVKEMYKEFVDNLDEQVYLDKNVEVIKNKIASSPAMKSLMLKNYNLYSNIKDFCRNINQLLLNCENLYTSIQSPQKILFRLELTSGIVLLNDIANNGYNRGWSRIYDNTGFEIINNMRIYSVTEYAKIFSILKLLQSEYILMKKRINLDKLDKLYTDMHK